MASYPAPTQNIEFFNPAFFTVDETALTIGEANKIYFKKSGGIITGSVSMPSLTLNGVNVENKLLEIDTVNAKLTDISYNNNVTYILNDLSVNGILKLPNLTNAGSEILNNKQKTTKISYDAGTSITTIGDTLKVPSTLIVGSNNYNVNDQFYKLTGISRDTNTPSLTITDSVQINGVLNLPNNGNVDVVLSNFDTILVNMEYVQETYKLIIDSNVNVNRDMVIDGSLNVTGNFELGTIVDVEQKIIDVSNIVTTHENKLTNISYNTGTTQIDGDLDIGLASTSNSNVDINGNLKIFQKIGTPPSTSGGSLTLVHDNVEGQSSIVFQHKRDTTDYGYIVYKDHVGTGTGQKSLLELGVQNNGIESPLLIDCISLMPSGYVGINTREPKKMLDVNGDMICNGNFELNSISDVEQKIIDVSNTVTSNKTKLTNLSFNSGTNVTEIDGSLNVTGNFQLNSISDVEQKIIDVSNTVTSNKTKLTNLSFNTGTNVTEIDGSVNITYLTLGNISNVEAKIIDISNNSSGGGIPSISYDSLTQTTTFDGSFIIVPSDCSFELGPLIPNLYSYIISLNSRTSWLVNTGQGLKIINNTIIEENLGSRTSQLSIRPKDDIQDVVQEIYSKNGTAELKIGDDNGTTLTFNNILKSENGNATFYGYNGVSEKKFMEYNSTDSDVYIGDQNNNTTILGKLKIQNVLFEKRNYYTNDGNGISVRAPINPSLGGSIFDVRSAGYAARLYVGNEITSPVWNNFYFGPTQFLAFGEEGNPVNYQSKLGVSGEIICKELLVNGDIDCSGIQCDEIRVNSIPINSFTNFRIAVNAIGDWGNGEHLRVTSVLLVPSYSHNEQFEAIDSSNSFICKSGYYGTYEITCDVIFKNLSVYRLNPCIGIAINDDINLPGSSPISPYWNLRPHYQTPFSVQYVRMGEGKVCNLSCKRIYNFTNVTPIEEVSINTYVERGGDTTSPYFNEVLTTSDYAMFDASIQFKYLGNFDNIQN